MRTAARGSERRTVTVWLMKGSASPEFVERFTEDFEEEHGDIDLDIRVQEWNGIAGKVDKALKDQGGDETEVIEVGNTQVARYVEGGLSDLTLESARDLGMDDWLPGLAETPAATTAPGTRHPLVRRQPRGDLQQGPLREGGHHPAAPHPRGVARGHREAELRR
ncbi:hypothetical protein SALBM135S_01136 [Streptomyces alboniger]